MSQNNDALQDEIFLLDRALECGQIQISEAQKKLNLLLRTTEDSYYIHLKFAELALIQGLFMECWHSVNACHEQDPENHRHLALNAVRLEIQGQHKDSRATLQKIAGELARPGGTTYFFSFCDHLSAMGSSFFQCAVKNLAQNIDLKKDDIKTLIRLCMEADLHEEGLFAAYQLVNYDPTSWVSYLGPAYFFEKLGQKEKAREFLKRAEALPDFRNDEFVNSLKIKLAA